MTLKKFKPILAKLKREVKQEQATLAAARGSVRTCEWETVAPPKICGKPAVFCTQAKYMCQEHGDAINRRWPGAAAPLQAPNKQIT